MLDFIINYWIEIFFSLIITILTYLYRKILKYLKKIDTLETQACLNLKFHIIERYKTINAKGYITMEEKEEINELYNSLKSIKCHNVADDIIKNINEIPLK